MKTTREKLLDQPFDLDQFKEAEEAARIAEYEAAEDRAFADDSGDADREAWEAAQQADHGGGWGTN